MQADRTMQAKLRAWLDHNANIKREETPTIDLRPPFDSISVSLAARLSTGEERLNTNVNKVPLDVVVVFEM